jgi:hypothetical protein
MTLWQGSSPENRSAASARCVICQGVFLDTCEKDASCTKFMTDLIEAGDYRHKSQKREATTDGGDHLQGNREVQIELLYCDVIRSTRTRSCPTTISGARVQAINEYWKDAGGTTFT